MEKIVLDKRKCLLCNKAAKPLFRFPNDVNRCSTWLKIIKKEYLLTAFSKDYIYNNGKLCTLHFKDEAYTSTLKTKLSKFAVPFLEDDGLAESVNCSPGNLHSELQISDFQADASFITSTPKPVSSYEPVPSTSKAVFHSTPVGSKADEEKHGNFKSPQKEENLIHSNSVCKKPKLTPKTQRIMTLSSNLSKCRRKILKLENSIQKTSLAESLKSKLTNIQYLFVMSQIRLHNRSKKGRRWSAEEKAMAYNIYCRSTASYNYLCDRFAFPSISTLRRSVGPIAKNTGICPILLHCLKKKIEKMKHEERFCILTFDDMSIKKGLSFNGAIDSVDGYESMERPEGKPQLAKEAMVFMIRGLTTNWKQIMSYYFRAKNCPEGWFLETVLEIIDVIQSCGLIVIALVCDQGPINQGLYRDLDVSPDKPFFMHKGKKIFTLHDSPHLLKSTRKNLKKYDISYKEFGRGENARRFTARWKDIEDFFHHDSLQRFKAAPKLTHNHIYAEGLSAMKVKLAAQVFSNRVAAGLSIYARANWISAAAVHTADFVGNMNDLFDSVNSSERFGDTEYKSAIAEGTNHITLWQNCIEWIKSWQFIDKETNKVAKAKPVFKNGWLLTLNALIGLWDELRSHFHYVLTDRFNQDPLENTFSSVRRKGGFSDNPNCTQFRNSIRAVIVKKILKKSKSANCEVDSDFNLIDFSKMDMVDMKKLYRDNEQNEVIEESENFPDITEKEVPEFSEIEENVLSTVTGYLSKVYLNKFPCNECKELLVGEKILNMRNFFLYFTDYKVDTEFGLKWPTDDFYKYMEKISYQFFKNFDSYLHKPNIRKNMCSILNEIPFTFFGNHEHGDHAKKVIVYTFVTMMIKHRIKSVNCDIYEPDKKKKKLNHVMNK